MKSSPCNSFFPMENSLYGNCTYVCRILYLIDILKMRSPAGKLSNTWQGILKYLLLTSLTYSNQYCVQRKRVCVSSLARHACPLICFSNSECWHQFPFPQIKKKRVPDFRLRKLIGAWNSDEEEKPYDLKLEACWLVRHSIPLC